MSSINPIVVFNEMDDQTTEEFTDGLMGSATLGTGQFCTNPGVVFHLVEIGARLSYLPMQKR